MTIKTTYNSALTQYQNSTPILPPKHLMPSFVTIRSCNKDIPRTHEIYKDYIQEDKTPCARLLNNIKLIKQIVSFEKAYKPSLPALLDPPLKGEISHLTPLLKALSLHNPDKTNIKNKTNFFFIRDLPSSVFPSQSVIKKAKTLLNAHDILTYSLSTKLPIPPLTKEVALKALYGEGNPFDNLTVLTELGQGTYGNVLLVQTATQKQYALKIEHQTLPGSVFEIEYKCLVLSNHHHIIKLLHVDRSQRALFLELAENGPLRTNLNPDLILKALAQISETLSYLHNQLKLVHSDIKITNILMDRNFDIKIADFSLAFFKKNYRKKEMEIVPYYLPPELLAGNLEQDESEKIDVWSFGILIWTFLKLDTILSPINDSTTSIPTLHWSKAFKDFEKDKLKKQLDPTKIKGLDSNGWLVHGMESCLSITPKDRPTMDELTELLADVILSSRKVKQHTASTRL